MPNTLPDWYTPEAAPVATTPQPAQAAAPQSLPDWYTPEAENVTVTAQKPESFGQQVGDLAGNIATGVGRIPGAIIGLPHTAAHAANWIWAQLGNAWNGVKPDGTWREGKDYDESNPLTKHTLSSEEVDKGVFDTLGVKPYEPESFVGKLLQAAVTGAGAGAADPFALLGAVRGGGALTGALEGAAGRAGKMALASDTASATQQAFPDDPGLALGAAVLAHSGAGAGARAAKVGYDQTIAPLLSPTARGEMAAGRTIGENAPGAGMTRMTQNDVDAQTQATRAATGKIPVGQDDYDAGGALRDSLQARRDQLVTDRKAATEASRGAFEAEPPMSVQKLDGFLQRPGFRRAMIEAGKSVKDEGNNPTVRYWDVEGAGAPEANPEGVPGIRIRVQALPPEVLDRIKGHLDDAVNDAKPGSRAQRSATILRDQFKQLLDDQYPNTYPKTREDYAANSRPLDPLETGPTGKVLDSEKRFGNRVYSMAQDKVVRSYLQQNSASASSVKNLVDAFGGDRKAALKALEDNLASKVQDAINADGTLSQQAFERAVRPYTKALNMHFPELAKKFANARSAQDALDLVKEQHGLTTAIEAEGALRGTDNFVTGTAARSWLSRNADSLARTQSKAALMRLQKIADALPDDPAAGTQASIEAASGVTGAATLGTEGGVLGLIAHKIPQAMFAPVMRRYYESYSKAVEKAFSDPAYAEDIAQRAVKFGGFKKVLRDEALKAALAAPIAVNASTPGVP